MAVRHIPRVSNWQATTAVSLLALAVCAGCAQPPIETPSASASASTAAESPAPSEIGSPTAAAEATPTPGPEPVSDPLVQEDPPPRVGSIRHQLDQKLDEFKAGIKFPSPEQATKTSADYFNDPAYMQYEFIDEYWSGKGEKVLFSTAPTAPSPCPLKQGQFIEEVFAETFDFNRVGDINFPADVKGSGPFKVDGMARQCFEHSTRGAVYAAMNLQFQRPHIKGFSSNEQQERVLYSKTRRTFNAINYITDEQIDPNNIAKEFEFVSPTGHRLLDYDESAVRLEVFNYYSNNGDGLTSVVPMTMVWEKGDWRIGFTGREETIDEFPEGFVFLSGFAGSSDDEG